MLLGDSKILELIDSGAVSGADRSNVGPVSYDLTTKCFYVGAAEKPSAVLAPGDSAFVASVEDVRFPQDVAGRVLLKNSRIRQGLSLDAPLYFPGHRTRIFFRVTNVSADEITLDGSRPIAQLVLETVDGVESPYDGAFADELDFRGMASYEDVFGPQVRKLEDKEARLEDIEHRVYGNVLALFAVFAAIFTLVNVNAGGAAGGDLKALAAVDLMVLGGFSTLAAVIDAIVSRRGESPRKWLLAVGLALVAASVLIAIA